MSHIGTLVTTEEHDFLQFLNVISKQGAVAVGMTSPVPLAAQMLVARGLCFMSLIGNPNRTPSHVNVVVGLTDVGRNVVGELNHKALSQ